MRQREMTSTHIGRLAFCAIWSFACIGTPASAATASELLEKGIYAEETVGDLDEAIRVYEKVVSEAKDSNRAAAEAQYRIGVCYQKQGKMNEASEAFQRVIDEYPALTELVRQAKNRLPAEPELLAAPWGDGDEMHPEMKLPTGMGIGLQVYRIAKSTENGREMWECSTWQAVTVNGQLAKSRVLMDKESFAPVKSEWKHSLLGQSEASYRPDQVVIQLKHKDEPTTLELGKQHYDNEQCAEIFRLLPLKVGYKTKLNVVSPLGVAKVPLTLQVDSTETVEVPAGTFECFRLKLNIGQTFWISSDENRYIVKFEGGGATGQLVKAGDAADNQSTVERRERFRITLPPNWYAYTPTNAGKDKTTTTYLIDPGAESNSGIDAGPLDVVKEDHESPRAWLESSLENYRDRFAGFSVGTDGVEAIKVGDRDAAAATFEYVDGEKKIQGRRIAIFGDRSAVDVRYSTAADQFARLQPMMEKLLSSLVIE